MVSLVEFLTARLDEDEAVAQPWLGRGPWNPYTVAPAWEYTGHFEPARVLAEVEAKRRIAALHGSYSRTYYDEATDTYDSAGLACEYCWDPGGDYGSGQPVPWPCDTLRLLALPYADHPDYDEAWRP